MGTNEGHRSRSAARIVLSFTTDERPELSKVDVTLANGEEFHTECGAGEAGDFQWGPGTRVISHFLLCYAAKCRKGNVPENFRYSGNEAWHVSLCSVFNKDKTSDWTTKMFGLGQSGHSCFWFWVIRRNPEGRKGKPRVFRPKVKDLPPNVLSFSTNGKPLETAEALETLAEKLEQQWPEEDELPPEQHKAEPESKTQKPRTGSTSTASPSAAHPVTSTSAEPTTSPQTKKKTVSGRRKRPQRGCHLNHVEKSLANNRPLPEQLFKELFNHFVPNAILGSPHMIESWLQQTRAEAIKEESSNDTPPRGNQSLTDWFRDISLDRILEYLYRIESWSQPTRAEAIKEVLTWESRHTLAQKLSDAELIKVLFFFTEGSAGVPLDVKYALAGVEVRFRAKTGVPCVPLEIKDAVSTLIATDPDLGTALRKNLKGFPHYFDAVWNWFAHCAKYFPGDFNAALVAEWQDPEYTTSMKKSAEKAGIARMTRDILYYMEHGFESVGVFIIEMLLKNNYSLLLPELKTKKGQRHVRKFWRKTKGFMKYALAKEVQAFLMTKGVIASKEM